MANFFQKRVICLILVTNSIMQEAKKCQNESIQNMEEDSITE